MYKENINNIAFRLVYPLLPCCWIWKKGNNIFSFFFLEQAYYFSMYKVKQIHVALKTVDGEIWKLEISE